MMSPIDVTPVDELIRQLQAVVDQAKHEGSRVGYFASLYTRITIAVRRAIAAGTFDDGAAVVQLDLAFARRYLTALDCYRRGDAAISPPWAVALGATERRDLSIVQQMALAMNAHINFDLGMAAFEALGAQDLWDAHGDFERVNRVLEAVVAEVEKEIAQVSPILRVVGGVSPALATWLIDFGLVEARALAWQFAATLAGARSDAARAVAGRATRARGRVAVQRDQAGPPAQRLVPADRRRGGEGCSARDPYIRPGSPTRDRRRARRDFDVGPGRGSTP